MNIKAVLLDAGGVLVVPDIERLTAVLHGQGQPGGEIDAQRAHFEAIAAMDHELSGLEPTTAYWQALVEGLGLAMDPPVVEAVAQLSRDPSFWGRPVDGVRTQLAALVETFPLVGVVSNSDGTIEQVLADAGICQVGPGSGVEIDAVIDSNVHAVAKPDPAIFDIALATVSASPHESLYVGDSVRLDVECARAAGLRAYHRDPYGLCPADDHDHLQDLSELLTAGHAERSRDELSEHSR